MKNISIHLAVLAAISFADTIFAANFNFTSGTTTTAQTLAAGETGSVSSGASLSVSGSGNAVTLSATSGTTTISNSGNILQTGTGRTIRNNTSGTPTFQITNTGTGLIRSADADTLRADVAGSNWTVNNSGIISSLNPSAGGSQAIDFDAITTGTVNITNNGTGQILAFAADAIRTGTNATIINAGTITSSINPADVAPSNDGIDAQARSGVNVTNTGTVTGRHGITGGATTFGITVTNNAGTISGVNGSGINIDGVFTTSTANVSNAFGATIRGGVISGSLPGDGDGVDVDGVLTLSNSGDILAYGAKGNGSDGLGNNPEGVAAGGGTITNTSTGRIIGSTLAADAPNGDTTRDGHGILVDNSSAGDAVAAVTINNSGLIQGKTGYAIKVIGTFADTVTNNAGGTIRGANNSVVGAAIQTGGGNDVVNNAGTIAHDGGVSQVAINLEGGDDTLNITGGSASITGGLDGGEGTDALNFNLGAPTNTFAYSGAINAFESVNANSGTTRLEGSTTLSAAANTVTVATGATLAAGSLANTGKLTLTLGSVQVDGSLAFRLNGTAAGASGGYDQLALSVANSGSFSLGGSSQLAISLGFAPTLGTEFILVDLLNPSATISGKFAGLDEGDTLLSGGQNFRVSYVGGTGNDLSVTAVPEAGTWASFLGAGWLGWVIRRRKTA